MTNNRVTAQRFTRLHNTMFAIPNGAPLGIPGELLQPVQTIWHVSSRHQIGDAIGTGTMLRSAVDDIDQQIADQQGAGNVTAEQAAYVRGCLYLGRALLAQMSDDRGVSGWLKAADETFETCAGMWTR